MQESTPTQWDPMMNEGRLPWSIRLLIIYLVAVLLVFCFRAIPMLWRMRSLRKAAQDANVFWAAWDESQAKVVSIKNWSVLTLLLTFLASAWNMTGTLREVSMQKIIGTAFLAATTADVLTAFCLGMLVCIVLYSFACFLETLLLSCKLRQPPRS